MSTTPNTEAVHSVEMADTPRSSLEIDDASVDEATIDATNILPPTNTVGVTNVLSLTIDMTNILSPIHTVAMTDITTVDVTDVLSPINTVDMTDRFSPIRTIAMTDVLSPINTVAMTQILSANRTITKLPDELPLRTMLYLDRTDLHACLFVCKRLSVMSEEALYKNIDLVKRGPRVYYLLRTLLDHPKLARHIWHIRLSDSFLEPLQPDQRIQPSLYTFDHEREVGKLTRSLGRLLKDSNPRNLYDLEREFHFKQDKVEAGLALVLSRCSNLRSIHLSFDCCKEDESQLPPLSLKFMVEFSVAMLRSQQLINTIPDDDSPSFQFFRKVYFDSVCHCCSFGPELFSAYHEQRLLCLPNIRSLTLYGLRKEPRNVWSENRPRALSLTHLTLTRIDVYGPELGELLKTCLSLKYLKYQYDPSPEEDGTLGLNELGTALSRVSETLEHLVVGISSTDVYYFSRITNAILDLSQFSSLHTLEIPIMMLLNPVQLLGIQSLGTTELANVLPPNLQKLGLSDWLDLGGDDALNAEWYTQGWGNPGSMSKLILVYIEHKSTQQQPLEEISILWTKNVEYAEPSTEATTDGEEWWPEDVVQDLTDLKDVCERFHVKWSSRTHISGIWNRAFATTAEGTVPIFSISL